LTAHEALPVRDESDHGISGGTGFPGRAARRLRFAEERDRDDPIAGARQPSVERAQRPLTTESDVQFERGRLELTHSRARSNGLPKCERRPVALGEESIELDMRLERRADRRRAVREPEAVGSCRPIKDRVYAILAMPRRPCARPLVRRKSQRADDVAEGCRQPQYRRADVRAPEDVSVGRADRRVLDKIAVPNADRFPVPSWPPERPRPRFGRFEALQNPIGNPEIDAGTPRRNPGRQDGQCVRLSPFAVSPSTHHRRQPKALFPQ